MTFCEQNGVDYIFALAGTKPLARKVDEVCDAFRTERAIENKIVVRGYTETRHAAGSWHRERRVVARIEATQQGLDVRYVVTSLDIGSAEWIYDSLYCARGQAENLIKLHKTQLASDRTSCRSALANQVRLVFHTAAYWLILAVRDAIPKPRDLATAEFNTIRLRLLSRSQPASSRPPPASVSPSLRRAPTPTCSAAWQTLWSRKHPDARGMSPRSPRCRPPTRSRSRVEKRRKSRSVRPRLHPDRKCSSCPARQS
ncbi:transposase [Bradyrhizobium sp. JR3.5]